MYNCQLGPFLANCLFFIFVGSQLTNWLFKYKIWTTVKSTIFFTIFQTKEHFLIYFNNTVFRIQPTEHLLRERIESIKSYTSSYLNLLRDKLTPILTASVTVMDPNPPPLLLLPPPSIPPPTLLRCILDSDHTRIYIK